MQEGVPAFDYKCNLCGCEVILEKYIPGKPITNLMHTDNLCFRCAYWKNILSDPDKKYEIVGGKAYGYSPIATDAILKDRLHTRYVMRNDKSINLLQCSHVIGTVPAEMNIADTGIFIPRPLYKRLTMWKPFQCRAKGCYDRYSCLWYDAKLQEPNGPWNAIPSTHKTGEEYCKSFIDKNTIYKTESL